MTDTHTREQIVCVKEKIWGPDDHYLVITPGEIQVFAEDGYKPGNRVKVTITLEKMEE